MVDQHGQVLSVRDLDIDLGRRAVLRGHVVVERAQFDSRGDGLADAIGFRVDLVRYLHGIAVWLPIDVKQNRRLSVRVDHSVNRFHAGGDLGNVTDTHRDTGRSCLDDDGRDLLRRVHLSVHQSEHELMVALEKPR